jgi:hypothetical protein
MSECNEHTIDARRFDEEEARDADRQRCRGHGCSNFADDGYLCDSCEYRAMYGGCPE